MGNEVDMADFREALLVRAVSSRPGGIEVLASVENKTPVQGRGIFIDVRYMFEKDSYLNERCLYDSEKKLSEELIGDCFDFLQELVGYQFNVSYNGENKGAHMYNIAPTKEFNRELESH